MFPPHSWYFLFVCSGPFQIEYKYASACSSGSDPTCVSLYHNKRVCPKLTNEQRQYRHDQRLTLGDELANAKKAYAQAAADIACKHGQ